MLGLPDIVPFRRRFEELEHRIAHPGFFDDPKRAGQISREHQKLADLIALWDSCERLQQAIAGNQHLARDPAAEPELRKLAEEELPMLEAQVEHVREQILESMLPSDPTDSRNTILEIRAGTGGSEAALFAGDLARMYSRLAENQGWKVEMLGASPSDAGGFKEVAFLISGVDVYRDLKFESGVHRVQRVPVTEASGRIHTSAATVAVLPEAEEVDLQIDPSDLEITVARASGPGGQGVNTTDSAVQVLHRPTGMIVKCADERSQLKNKAKAMKVLRARLLARRQEEEAEKYARNRRDQVGSGDRSERIRTYNFPQGRVTDHRIGLTLYSIEGFMDGDLQEMIHALQQADRSARIRQLQVPPI